MKKFAVIVGHTKDSQGANSPYGIPSEYHFNSEVAKYLTDIADIYYYDTYKGGYSAMVRRLYNHINQHDYDLTIELHYNAAGALAHGTEVLYYANNRKGLKLAENLSSLISSKFGTKDRGAKGRGKSDRGGYALYAGKATALLLEPFFGTNKDDVNKFKGQEKKYAGVIKDFLNGRS